MLNRAVFVGETLESSSFKRRRIALIDFLRDLQNLVILQSLYFMVGLFELAHSLSNGLFADLKNLRDFLQGNFLADFINGQIEASSQQADRPSALSQPVSLHLHQTLQHFSLNFTLLFRGELESPGESRDVNRRVNQLQVNMKIPAQLQVNLGHHENVHFEKLGEVCHQMPRFP